MIRVRSRLTILDNSGAKMVRCVKVLGGFQRRHAVVGDTIVVVVARLRTKNKYRAKVKKGEVLRAVISQTRRPQQSRSGVQTRFEQNTAILVNKQGKPLATRILGPVSKELKQKGHLKLASLATGFL